MMIPLCEVLAQTVINRYIVTVFSINYIDNIEGI